MEFSKDADMKPLENQTSSEASRSSLPEEDRYFLSYSKWAHAEFFGLERRVKK